MNQELVKQINDSPYKIYLAITGGGQTFIGDYLKCGGASNTLIGAFVPYSKYAFDKFTKGAKIDSYASEEAARKLAVAAYNECLEAGVAQQDAIGLGAANSIVKEDERNGRVHKINISIHTQTLSLSRNLVLHQGRTREHEERIISDLILQELTRIILKNFDYNLTPYLGPKETDNCILNGGLEYRPLFDGSKDYIIKNGKIPDNLIVFSGSFNPFHQGHKELYEEASSILAILGDKPVLEMTFANPDKGQVDFIEMEKRISALKDYPLIISNAGTYEQKINYLSKFGKPITFIMGWDTWQRIWNQKYTDTTLLHLYEKWKALGVKFLVFGRGDNKPIKTNNPLLWHIDDLRIKSDRAERYNNPISSTELRGKIKEEE